MATIVITDLQATWNCLEPVSMSIIHCDVTFWNSVNSLIIDFICYISLPHSCRNLARSTMGPRWTWTPPWMPFWGWSSSMEESGGSSSPPSTLMCAQCKKDTDISCLPSGPLPPKNTTTTTKQKKKHTKKNTCNNIQTTKPDSSCNFENKHLKLLLTWHIRLFKINIHAKILVISCIMHETETWMG